MIALKPLNNIRKFKQIGVLTSGGDSPGMNAAIRAVVRYGISQNCRIQGILRGYSGIFQNQFVELHSSSVANIIQRGGTILKTDRCEDFYQKSKRKRAYQILSDHEIEALVVIGGDGSFRGAHLLEKETGFPVIGIPGTIDNDIPQTDASIGFDTAVNTAIEAIDRIRDTANSHDRIFLVEVMGNSTGFIALQVALAGGAENVILPTQHSSSPENIRAICSKLQSGVDRGKTNSIIVVAEGAKPGLSHKIDKQLTRKGFSARVCILGHTQRGGTPTTHDRVLASALGASAVSYLLAGKSNSMVGVQAGEVELVPFTKVMSETKKLPLDLLKLAQTLA